MQVIVNAPPELAPVPSGEKKEMLGISREGNKVFVRINSSSLSLLQECPRKTYYSLVKGYRSNVESSATLYGSAIHAALETFYLGSREERVLPPDFQKQCDLMGAGATPSDGESKYLVLRAMRSFLDKALPLAALPSSDKRSHATGVWTLQHYFQNYIEDPFSIHADSEGKFVERRLEADVFDSPELRITLFETIDCILINDQTKAIFVCDHKTSSVIGEQFYNRLKPNHQYSAYILLAKENGIDTDKFLVNCIQVKPKPLTKRGSPPHFPRQVTVRSDDDLAEFTASLAYYVKQFVALSEEPESSWPMSQVNACSMYNGCQYLKVCGAPVSLRENILNAEYSL